MRNVASATLPFMFAMGIVTVFNAGRADAFVLLSKTPRRLESSPANPTVTFKWNESTPAIKDKENLFDGAHDDLGDVEYMALMLQLAMDQWNDVHGSYLRLAFERDPAVVADTEDRVHAITVSSKVGATAAAFAQFNYQVGGNETNTIGDCDIHLSESSVAARDMVTTLVHELGHCVGLGHNHTNYQSIMGYSRSGNSYKLSADDKAGVTWLYPDPAVSDEAPAELVACGVMSGLGNSPRAGGGFNAIVWLLLALPLVVAIIVAMTGAMTGETTVSLMTTKVPRAGARGRN